MKKLLATLDNVFSPLKERYNKTATIERFLPCAVKDKYEIIYFFPEDKESRVREGDLSQLKTFLVDNYKELVDEYSFYDVFDFSGSDDGYTQEVKIISWADLMEEISDNYDIQQDFLKHLIKY